MTRLRAAAVGAWEFLAGDDWVTAIGVLLALGVTGLVSEGSEAWFVMPLAVGLLLTLSIWREARKHDQA
ncbi:MAG TPA: hypothetical protein VGJ61_09205 [Solirubrobacterales bacterium]|jgi:hypothetical protein